MSKQKLREILCKTQKICRDNGIKFLRVNKSQVMAGNEMCSGYFDDTTRTLCVAVDNPPFRVAAVLFHEVGHLMQWRAWKDGKRNTWSRNWAAAHKHGGVFEGREGMRSTLALELQVERFTLRMLRKYKICTPEEYRICTQSAALYLFSHHTQHATKRWFKRHVDLWQEVQKPEVASLLPLHLRGIDFANPPPRLKRYLKRLFI